MTTRASRRLCPGLLLPGWLLLASMALAQEPVQPEATITRSSIKSGTATGGMVVAAHPLAAQAGQAVLAEGGNAIDSLVAVQMMLALVEPQSSGLGGGAFLLYFDAAQGRLYSFDGRETAPAAADEGYFLDDFGQPRAWWSVVPGGLSVGVPGLVKLLDEVHGRFGQRPWPDLLAPAIAAAEDGFAVTPRLAGAVADAQQRGLAAFPAAKGYFFGEDNQPPAPGDVLRNPELAHTLRALAQERSTPFYQGDLATAIVETVQHAPVNAGVMTLEDLAAYQVVERAPVCLDYRGFEVCGMGPPSSGGLTVAYILGLLRGFPLAELGPGVDSAHLFIEASKLAYADRGQYMADSDFVAVPVDGLLDSAYLQSRASLIDPARASGEASAGKPPHDEGLRLAPHQGNERPGTTHISIIDAMGNAVSMTSSIETGFGSRLMVGGFLLNNQLTDFSFVPERDGVPVANRVEAGKRPRSSMSPTIVLQDGRPVILTGSPGGSRIIAYTARSLIGLIDHGMSPGEAAARPHVVNRNGATDIEDVAQAKDLADALVDLGHEVGLRDLNSGLHIIAIDGEVLHGGADPRREGVVLGHD